MSSVDQEISQYLAFNYEVDMILKKIALKAWLSLREVRLSKVEFCVTLQ